MAVGLVLDPRPAVGAAELGRADRQRPRFTADAADLSGVTIGIRRDQLWRSWDWVTDDWADRLLARGATVVMLRARSPVGKEADAVLAELEEFIDGIDYAIFGLANCGSCTLETVREAKLALDHGVPVTVVGTEQFEPLARKLGALSGWHDLPLLTLPFPLETRSRDEVRDIASEHLKPALAFLADAS
jgi:hypothetical protein